MVVCAPAILTLFPVAAHVAEGDRLRIWLGRDNVAHEGFARAVADFLARERAHIDDVVDVLDERSVIKK